jgi:hypothetical protein
MMRPIPGLHPSFHELSAHADRADTDAARSRVGRHVAACTACRDTVAEIRGLGDAARASDVPGAPEGIWARIERRMNDESRSDVGAEAVEERPVSVGMAREGAPSPAVNTGNRLGPRTVRRASLGLGLVIAATAAVIAIDAREPLAAATPRRLTSDREFARPGGTITFHYRPIEQLANERSLTVWMLVPGRGETRFDQALERAGTLRRVSALDFTGPVTMPDSTPLAMFVVGDSTGEILDRSEARAGQLPNVVLAADAAGHPRLDAFVMALGMWRGAPDTATRVRWAKRMRDLYPTEPETWILTDEYAHRGVISDIVKLFESRERRYYGWHDRLENRKRVSEVAELMMANMGWELMDTARAEFWTSRLMRDHPTSRWLPGLWIRPYRDVPDDSAAEVLRAFEPVYTRAAGGSYDALSRALSLADRSGDPVLIRRWHLRVDPRNMSGVLGTELSRFANDAAARSELRRRLLQALAETDSAMHGGPTLFGRSRFFAWVDAQRIRTRLAALQLLDGDASAAKAMLDSVVREAELRPSCPSAEAMRWRAEASRRLGATNAARADLAYVIAVGDWHVQVLSDSAPALLGPSFTKASWDRALAEARAYKQKCWAASRDARGRADG